MTAPRRRIVRPQSNGQAATQQRQRQLDGLRGKLERERAALTRWQKRLRRAFAKVEKTQLRIARLEKQLARHSA